MTHPTHAYARSVVAREIIAGPHVRAACERHLRDLERDDIHFDEAAADRAIQFFPTMLQLSGGEWEGAPFELLPWLQFVTGALFGWKRSDGYRRFRRAYIEVGKGGAKSPWAAGVGLYMCFCEGEVRAQGYVMARQQSQALVSFSYAVQHVKSNPEFAAAIRIVGGDVAPKNLVRNGSFLRILALEREGKGGSGPTPHFVLADEMHEMDDRNQLEIYAMGTKSRRQPLVLMITNSGADELSPCGQEHAYAVKVAEGDVEADSYFSYVCAVDEKDDYWNDRDTWVKTCPSLPSTPGYEYIQEQIDLAEGMPSHRSLVERLVFCKWVEAADPFLDRDTWIACEIDEPKLEALDLTGPCWLGLDLSSRTDLSALSAVWQLPDGAGYAARAWAWMPDHEIAAREQRDGAPYRLWAERGHLTLIPGTSIEYAWIARQILAVQAENDVKGIAYDPFRIDQLEKALDALGIEWTRDEDGPGLRLAGHSQGFLAGSTSRPSENPEVERRIRLYMPRSLDDTEAVIKARELLVLHNPALRWAALRCVVIVDDKLNRSISKRKATSRIDPFVALVQAIGYARSEYSAAEERAFSVEDYLL